MNPGIMAWLWPIGLLIAALSIGWMLTPEPSGAPARDEVDQ